MDVIRTWLRPPVGRNLITEKFKPRRDSSRSRLRDEMIAVETPMSPVE